MNNKIVIFSIIILIAAVGIFWLTGDREPANESAENGAEDEQLQQVQKSVSASTSTISQTDRLYNIKADYPQFTNVSQEFNDKISKLVKAKIDEFKLISKESWDARKATAPPSEGLGEYPQEPFDFIVGWKPIQVNDKYVSFTINIYYYSGGAHGINEINAFNYDVKNQKEITIDDFLSDSSLEKLSQLAKNQVVLQFQSNGMQMDNFLEQMISDGTKPTPDNYENFNFNKDSLIIYFQQYQVAPGSAGQVTITFDKNMLEGNSIKSDYLK
jgi:hypothetical protein